MEEKEVVIPARLTLSHVSINPVRNQKSFPPFSDLSLRISFIPSTTYSLIIRWELDPSGIDEAQIVKLGEVAVSTGEEDEDPILDLRAPTSLSLGTSPSSLFSITTSASTPVATSSSSTTTQSSFSVSGLGVSSSSTTGSASTTALARSVASSSGMGSFTSFGVTRATATSLGLPGFSFSKQLMPASSSQAHLTTVVPPFGVSSTSAAHTSSLVYGDSKKLEGSRGLAEKAATKSRVYR
ncbi:uncharacterized serine-rich protein C215.13-like [Juglans microcarpa x Juglans regia]|uniref:uncharacterized serine-rich protein C215.13-like n=1 Tax=Juglans microcarpa x Juglans regia TaxID=2249226 RepID=UPI001B7EC708|nr:uncharacterized serine-rich protein C215.13-like [Juglans microcarpa x Juglans regia]